MSVLINPLNFFFKPSSQWARLADSPLNHYRLHLIYPLLMALIPSFAWYHGITEVGWSVGGGDVIRVTPESALPIIGLFYAAMIVSVAIIGYMTHWMSKTYGADTSIAKGISVTGFFATPLFVGGLVGYYPVLWLNMTIGILAISWAVYLLYIGIPAVMKLPTDRGFLYASAIAGVGLVIFICILVSSVILWDFGFAPEFTD